MSVNDNEINLIFFKTTINTFKTRCSLFILPKYSKIIDLEEFIDAITVVSLTVTDFGYFIFN